MLLPLLLAPRQQEVNPPPFKRPLTPGSRCSEEGSTLPRTPSQALWPLAVLYSVFSLGGSRGRGAVRFSPHRENIPRLPPAKSSITHESCGVGGFPLPVDWPVR